MIYRTHAERVLRPDNHELFDHVRGRVLSKDPVYSMQQIADECGVSVDQLCRWIMDYRAPRKRRQSYQSPVFSAIGQPRRDTGPDWARSDTARKFLAWKREHDGVRETRRANEAADRRNGVS